MLRVEIGARDRAIFSQIRGVQQRRGSVAGGTCSGGYGNVNVFIKVL
jgi:hypothetical protein